MLVSLDLVSRFRMLMADEALEFLFQPIVDVGAAEILGYEALMRGPEGPLRTPEELLRVAKSAGMGLDLERLACTTAVRAFARSRLPGKLFLNLSAPLMHELAREAGGDLLGRALALGISPSRLVLELTEHERVEDADALQDSLRVLEGLGMGLALDDFGDGRSSLRLWVQLKPQMVKLDKYFIRGIHCDSRKVEAIRSLQRLSEALGTPLVAEGVEESAELAVLRDLGCAYAQGFFLGRPHASPVTALGTEAVSVLTSAKIAVIPPAGPRQGTGPTVERLLVPAPTMAPEHSNEDLLRVFAGHPELHAVAVVEQRSPIGLINRRNFLDKYAQPYHRELYGRRSCTMFMNANPLRVETAASIDSLVTVLMGDDQRYLYDGFVITDQGRYAGLATGESLVRAVTERRIEAARHANPLTFLPGNIPLTEHIRRLLDAQVPFAACYFDLNNFKPYNDLYGYWRGDEMIKLVAQVVLASCDPTQDFVGHVGGDDFVALFQSEDWEARCAGAVETFNRRARGLFDPVELARGGFESEDRRGFRAFFPLTTISAGIVVVSAGQYRSPEEVASAAASAKKTAKQTGSGIHVLRPREEPVAQRCRLAVV